MHRRWKDRLLLRSSKQKGTLKVQRGFFCIWKALLKKKKVNLVPCEWNLWGYAFYWTEISCVNLGLVFPKSEFQICFNDSKCENLQRKFKTKGRFGKTKWKSIQTLLIWASFTVGCAYTQKFSFALKHTPNIVSEQEESKRVSITTGNFAT